MAVRIDWNKRGWDALTKQVIDTDGVRRMKRVADAANAADGLEDEDGYRVSVEGDGQQLQQREYRATVITATAGAMRANARNNTLVNELHRAGGE